MHHAKLYLILLVRFDEELDERHQVAKEISMTLLEVPLDHRDWLVERNHHKTNTNHQRRKDTARSNATCLNKKGNSLDRVSAGPTEQHVPTLRPCRQYIGSYEVLVWGLDVVSNFSGDSVSSASPRIICPLFGGSVDCTTVS